MSVEIGTEAPQFPEKEYINRIFLAGYRAVNEKSSVVLPRCNSSLWALRAILPLDQATIISIRNCADHPVIDQFSSRLIIGPLIILTTD